MQADPGTEPALDALRQVDALQGTMDQEAGMAFVFGGEGQVVVNPVQEPGGRTEHEEIAAVVVQHDDGNSFLRAQCGRLICRSW